ncbi:MAG: hypothetical protein KDK75_11640, partial [Alphaproteobacteria bacterium]|nr:hypothetical protein [Alphaproteobacteria bacterium]
MFAPIAVLPFLAGLFIQAKSLQSGLQGSVEARLAEAGADWAKVSVEGRDVVLTGDSPFQAYLDKALDTVSGTYGVRRVDSRARVVEPPALPQPAVDSLLTREPAPAIHGTWGASLSNSLKITVGESPYTLGTSPELTADGDAWTLKLASPLADGEYDVSAEAGDKYSRTAVSAAPGKLTIDTMAPSAPTVEPVTVAEQPFAVSGTWAEGDAVSLVVKLGDRLWTLGKDAALSSDGQGKWSLTSDIDLAPGHYDLTVETADKAGNVAKIMSAGAVTVPQPPELVPPTVESLLSASATPEISGTWPSDVANALKVTVGDTPYVLNQSPELTTSGKDWHLKLSSPLPDRDYPITVEAGDRFGRTAMLAEPGKLTIDTTAPAAPTVQPVTVTAQPFTVSGTWAEGDA